MSQSSICKAPCLEKVLRSILTENRKATVANPLLGAPQRVKVLGGFPQEAPKKMILSFSRQRMTNFAFFRFEHLFPGCQLD